MSESVVFCITCKGRTQHIEQTLPANLKDNPGAKFVLLNYNSPDHLNEYLLENHKEDMESGGLVTYHSQTAGPFRMAHAKNMSHRLGILEGGTILVNLDADNYTGPGFADYVVRQMTGNVFLWSRMIKGVHARGISGRIAVDANTFIKVGGYDERFGTWSPDDKDFNQRLCRLGLEGREIDPRHLLAVLHNDKMRFREYPHARGREYDHEQDFGHSEKVVVNGGRFGMGAAYRNFSDNPVILGPVPTRIFGIGMHKTATTSLHHALHTLGYESAHWKSAHWAKAIWREMTETGLSRTLEKSYALCDLPIPLLYRELDLAYPGSKFILTMRHENKWVESVRNHWSEANPFRPQWDNDPFTHKAHTLLYGRKTFDEAVFRARYQRHMWEVVSYFKNRPGDLLLMNMDDGAGWGELCDFLDRPIPAVPYPVKFQTLL